MLYALPAELRADLLLLIDRGIHPACDFATVASLRARLEGLPEVRVAPPTPAEDAVSPREEVDERHAD